MKVGDDVGVLGAAPVRVTGGLLDAAPWQQLTKRVVDVVGSLALLLLLAPLLLLVALAVRVTSPGPCLYWQTRVGRDGSTFRIAKFRSMRVGADAQLATLLDANEVTGPVFKIRDDPRVTPLGHWLRRLSIDELPQLVSVLRGHMSLVGPRPPLPSECEHYTPRHWGRLSVKPGLTCVWQVSGRSEVDFETWVDMDLHYIREWSLGLDLVLLVRTIPAVLGGRGAY